MILRTLVAPDSGDILHITSCVS